MKEGRAKKVEIDAILKQFRRDCEGICFGMGIGSHLVFEPCPDDCDKDLLDRVKEQAKNEAWAEAQKHCKGGRFCSCHGSYSTVVREQCVPVETFQGQKGCLYFAQYAYLGECGNWF